MTPWGAKQHFPCVHQEIIREIEKEVPQFSTLVLDRDKWIAVESGLFANSH
jgi:hypothetical protein